MKITPGNNIIFTVNSPKEINRLFAKINKFDNTVHLVSFAHDHIFHYEGEPSPRASSSWLQGTLTPSPTSIKEDQWLGQVYIEDQTGAIACEVKST